MTSTVPSSTLLSALATAYSNAAQSRTAIESDIINSQLQKRLQQKIDALQGPVDTVLIQSNQDMLTQLQAKQTATNQISQQFGTDTNIFADLSSQLGTMQTAMQNGDSASFDRALSQASLDTSALIVVPPTAPYQSDGVEQFKTNGLGINSASSYDLTTAAGQAAAKADVQNAQEAALRVSGILTSNQLVAASQSAALSTQINSLSATVDQQQNENQTYITNQTNQLTQLEQDQANLIQLGLGNSTALSSALQTATTAASIASSPFDVLGSSSSSSNGSNPAVLSLLV